MRRYFSDSADPSMIPEMDEEEGSLDTEQQTAAELRANAIENEDILIDPPADPVATANLISMVDPEKIEPEDIEIIAEATGSDQSFVSKVLDLVAKSVEEAEESTQEAAQENYSNRMYRLCTHMNFSTSEYIDEGKTLEEKLTEIVDIIPTFADEVLESVDSREIAETLSAATGVDADAAEALVNIAQSQVVSQKEEQPASVEESVEPAIIGEPSSWEDVEDPQEMDTYIEDHDEYNDNYDQDDLELIDGLNLHQNYSRKNFSHAPASIIDEVADAWKAVSQDVAIGARDGAKKAVNAIKSTPLFEDLSRWNKTSLQPGLIKVQKTIENKPGILLGAAIAPFAVANLASMISDVVSMRAAADEEAKDGNEQNAEALDNASTSGSLKTAVALSNITRCNMSRHFVVNFADSLYQDPRLEELDAAKNHLADLIYSLGAYYNDEEGFWSQLSDFISKYRLVFGGALASIIVGILPKFVSVNGAKIFLKGSKHNWFDKMSNIFNRDPAWIAKIRDLDSFVRDNPATSASSLFMALGTAAYAWIKSSQVDYEALPERVKDLLSQIKYEEVRIKTLEASLGSEIASDLAAVTQPENVVRENMRLTSTQNFSNEDSAELENIYGVNITSDGIEYDGEEFGKDQVFFSPEVMSSAEAIDAVTDIYTDAQEPTTEETSDDLVNDDIDNNEASYQQDDLLTADQQPVVEEDTLNASETEDNLGESDLEELPEMEDSVEKDDENLDDAVKAFMRE